MKIQIMPVMNNTTMNTRAYKFVLTQEWNTWIKTAALHGKCMFNYLRVPQVPAVQLLPVMNETSHCPEFFLTLYVN